MAFVHRSARLTSSISSNTSADLGPGCYNATSPSASPSLAPRISYAPFSSSSERGIARANVSAAPTDYQVGPGEYHVNINYVKPAQPAIQTSFISQVPRFGRNASAESVPGPGSYGELSSLLKPSHKRNLRKSASASTTTPWQRVSAAPSIPIQQQAFGYEEDENGDLILQKPTTKNGYTGVGVDAPGPGSYLSFSHVDVLATSKKTGFVEFGRSRSHRPMNIRADPAKQPPGPGSYLGSDAPTQSSIIPSKSIRNRQAVFFKSKVKRLDTHSMPKDTNPGPGHYSVSSSFDKLHANLVPEQYQFFGSKTTRSLAELKSNSITPGPGTYIADPRSHTAPTQDPYAPKLSFASTTQRFQVHKEVINAPGPGAYIPISNTSFELSKKIFGRNTSFGSTDERFNRSKSKSPQRAAQQTSESSVGPGSYQIPSTIKHHKKPLSVFVSTSKRFEAAKQHEEKTNSLEVAPPPTSLSSPIGIGNELTYGNSVHSHPSSFFASSQSRFASKPSHAVSVDVGAYDPNYSILARGSGGAGSSFKATERNFHYQSSKNPGPGSYTPDISPQNSSLIKKSFNITIANDL